jgi:glucokinase
MSIGVHLVADIGGTNARFALAEITGSSIALHSSVRLPVANFPTIEDAIDAYIKHVGRAPTGSACFAFAGPISGDTARLTNAAWLADASGLKKRFSLTRVHLINDFIGQARGAPLTPSETVVPILPGDADPQAPIAVLGPGTGLGLAFVTPTATGLRAQSTEGGHAAFAPRDATEAMVLQHIQQTASYVSFEMIVSGPGLERIDAALQAQSGGVVTPRSAKDIVAALPHDAHAQETVRLFCAALGTFAGDAVLIGGARGGVYLSGGILPRIQTSLLSRDFAERFRNRGPMSAYVAPVPVRLITDPDVALRGAAAICAEHSD